MIIQNISLQKEQIKNTNPTAPTQQTKEDEQKIEDTQELETEETSAAEEQIIKEEAQVEEPTAEYQLAPDADSLRIIFNTLGIPWESSKMTYEVKDNTNN
jgi:hypothetical protein